MFATLRSASRCFALVALAVALILLPAIPAAARPEAPPRSSRPLLISFDQLFASIWQALVPTSDAPTPASGRSANKNGPEADPYGHKGVSKQDRTGGATAGGKGGARRTER